MLKKIIHKLVRRRHFWRDASFDELAEIYASMSLRSMGFSLIGIFVPIFLYQNGNSLQQIFLFYTLFFVLRIPVSIATAYVVGTIGPKHSIAMSTVLISGFFGMLLTYNVVQWPLAFLAFFFTLANGLFFTAYHTDFSKIKDSKHGGKELGYLYIFERFGSAIGPLVGGIVASFISPNATIILAIVVLLGSLIPLFLTNEPVKIHQSIKFRGFPAKRHMSDFVAMCAFGVDNFASVVLWPLLVGVLIFTEDTYATIGSIIAVSMVISMFSAKMFGKFIDSKKGLPLLQYGAVMNALIHFIRPFINSGGGAVAVSTVNEPITLSYRMPLTKGYYDAADSEEGYRIVYLVNAEIFSAVLKSLLCIGLYVSSYYFDPIDTLRYGFIFVAIISLGMLLQKFPALNKN